MIQVNVYELADRHRHRTSFKLNSLALLLENEIICNNELNKQKLNLRKITNTVYVTR